MDYAAPSIELHNIFGTVWNGGARLPERGVLTCGMDGRRTILAGAASYDTSLTGPGTDLAGRLTARSFDVGDAMLDKVTGNIAWQLLAAVVPDLPLACDATASLQEVSLRLAIGIRAGPGRLGVRPGACAYVSGQASPMDRPGLVIDLSTDAEGLHATIIISDDTVTTLALSDFSNDGRIVVAVRPDCAVLISAMRISGGTTIEYLFDWPPE